MYSGTISDCLHTSKPESAHHMCRKDRAIAENQDEAGALPPATSKTDVSRIDLLDINSHDPMERVLFHVFIHNLLRSSFIDKYFSRF